MMNFADKRYRIGQISGIPLYISIWFIIIFAFFALRSIIAGSLTSIIWISIIAVTIVLHELGHAFAARRYGDGIHGITLHLFGGVMEHSGWLSRKQSIVVSIAGPAVNAAIVALLFPLTFLTIANPTIALVLRAGIIINLALMIFNLLPIYPLDGGQITRKILEGKYDKNRAIRLGSIISLVAGGLTIIGVIPLSLGLIGILIVGMTVMININELRAHPAQKRPKPKPQKPSPLFFPSQDSKGKKGVKETKSSKKKPKRKDSIRRVEKLLKRALKEGLDTLEPEARSVLVWSRTTLEQKAAEQGFDSLTPKESSLLERFHELERKHTNALH